METFDENDIQYQQAKKQVESLRAFYTHLFAYLVVNILIVFYNYSELEPGESYFQFKNFFTATLWGIGLVAHGITVFLPKSNYVKKWEDRKIKEMMGKQKESK
ncbi:histidine kinase [Chryseobacterium phosphatilyticum]|uniref:Histidine kinase n=1 Tax=Chryseobacterium phosphatilyticum TaxID=475075 RepID=A0A316X468_9FLAO|nr:2TM domain-containing protein [Chryseobacterium phosphatilyticum]PWN68622.1 histidine kinase [Chryseobacterium phosphatilyticum]